VAGYERFGLNVLLPRYDGGSYLYLLLFTVLVWPFIADRYAISSFDELYTENTALIRSLFASGAVFLLDAAVLALGKSLVISRIFFIVACVHLLLMAVITRFIFRSLVKPPTKLAKRIKVLVVGADKHAHWAAIRLNCAPLANCVVSAYLALPGQDIRVKGAPIFGMEDFEQLQELNVDNVFVAVGPDRYAEVARLYGFFKKLGKPIYAVLDFGSKIHIREKFFQIGRLQVVNLEPSATERFGYSVTKRGFDLIVSSGALLVLSPALAMIALLVRMTSQGPILFRQERVGLNGMPFDMYKFRTMRCAHRDESDKRWTTENDPRRTRLGAFLRRTSLDELPQLFNVMRGDMSIVGPRPERPHFVSKFRDEIEKYDLRHRAKVGITGWAQVNGLRGDTSIRKRVNYDVYYLQHWSLTFDLRIIFLTLRSIIFDQHAY
jgi:Undecaprenyl-phosphate glucose phosphotransferase